MKCSKLLCLGMAVVLACSGLPQMTYQTYGETVEMGTIDENGFQINENGILTKYSGTATDVVIPEGVTGIGANAFTPATYMDTSEVVSVTIPKGVKSIGDRAFYNCVNLTSVSMPEGVTSIGSDAFGSCRNLKYLNVPDSVTDIGARAFNNCWQAEGIKIPKAVKNIGDNAFAHSSITSAEFPEGIQSIGRAAFMECQYLTDVTIPADMTDIGMATFAVCRALTEFHISEGNSTFMSYDGGLYRRTDSGWELYFFSPTRSEVEFPEGVTSIGDSAFQWCNITEIEFPEGITEIGPGAFWRCEKLTDVRIPEGVTVIEDRTFERCLTLEHINIPESVTEIGWLAFSGCDKLTNITIPKGVTSIRKNAFEASIGLTDIVMPENITSIEDYTFAYCRSLTSITIPERVTSIGNNAFSECDSLTSITIPERVTSIGDNAFSTCGSLTSIVIPESVTSIGSNAFSKCENVTIYGQSGSYAQTYAQENNIPFSELTDLSACQIDISETKVAYSGEECKVDVIVKAGDTILTEGTDYELAYENNINVGTASVTINGKGIYTGSVTKTFLIVPADEADCEIDENGVFVKYTGTAAEVVIPSRVTAIGEYAFAGCENLTGVTIPEGVTSIGDNAFSACMRLTSITIPESVADIGQRVFSGDSSLTEIGVSEENSVYTSYDGCLYRKEGLELVCCPSGKSSIEFPEGVTKIGAYAFDNCGYFGSITIPESVTSIADHAFYGSGSLTKITIPENVTSIGADAFAGCSNLTIYAKEGSYAQTYALENNIPFSVIVVSETKELSACQITVMPGQVEYTGGQLTVTVTVKNGTDTLTEGVDYSVAYANNMNVGTAEVTLTGMGKYTGSVKKTFEIVEKEPEKEPSDTKELSACQIMVMPGQMEYTGGQLTVTVTVKDGTDTLTEGVDYSVAYANNVNVGIAEVTLTGMGKYAGSVKKTFEIVKKEPEKETDCKIEDGVFVKYTGTAADVVIPEGVTVIGESAFDGCTNLRSVTVPNGVTSIGDNAFRFCKSLTNITIPEKVTDIGQSAFTNCTSLTKIHVSEKNSVYLSYDGCLYQKDNLELLSCPGGKSEITFLNGVKSIAGWAFDGCSLLTEIDIPKEVTNIGQLAFAHCSSLKSITIPEGVQNIAEDAFNSCTGLTIYGKEGSYAQDYAQEHKIPFGVIGGSQTQTQTKELSSCTITVSSDKFTYNGKEQRAAVIIKDGIKQLKEGTDYTVEYRNNINAGTAQIILNGKGTYTGTVARSFTIEQAAQELSYTGSYKKTYGNKPFGLNVGRKAGEGELTYKSDNEKVVYADENGKVTIRNTGTAVITVQAKATQNYKEASVKITVDVRPVKQAIKKLKIKTGRKLTISWKKDARATGYEVRYSTDKKFKKNVKKLAVKKNKTVSKTVAKLAKGKRYYVKVRAYKSVKVNGKTKKLYGAWSTVKRSGKVKK